MEYIYSSTSFFVLYFTGLGSLRLPYNHLAIACVQAYGAIKINLAVIII
jgi:hypothetical protein